MCVCVCAELQCTVLCIGEANGDDLVVLLSEKVAKEIHKKWVDTLEVSIV